MAQMFVNKINPNTFYIIKENQYKEQILILENKLNFCVQHLENISYENLQLKESQSQLQHQLESKINENQQTLLTVQGLQDELDLYKEASEELRLNYERISSELIVANTKIIEQLQKIHQLFYQLEAEAEQGKERLNNKNYELDDHKKKHQIVSANLQEAQLQIDGLEESVNNLTRDLVELQKINQDLLIEKENLNLQNEKQKKEHLKDLDDQIHAQVLEIAELKEKQQQQLTSKLHDNTIQYENQKYKQATLSDHEETVKRHQKSRTDTKLKEKEVEDLKIQIKELTEQYSQENYDLKAKNTTLEAQLQANILIYKQLQIILTQKFN